MIQYRFNIAISYDQFMDVYRSSIQRIIVQESGGKRISLPATKFMPFVSHVGIRGEFLLILNEDGSFISLEKLR